MDAMVYFDLWNPTATWVLFSAVITTGVFVYGIRGLYFSIFQEAGVPAALTGTAAGIVSVLGFTPDIFIGPVNGYFTDTYPGAEGHRLFHGFLMAFAIAGLFATLAFRRVTRTPPPN